MESGTVGEMSSGWHFTFAGIFESSYLGAVRVSHDIV